MFFLLDELSKGKQKIRNIELQMYYRSGIDTTGGELIT